MRPLALACGVLPELSPVATIRGAAAGGSAHIGLWVELARGTSASTGDGRAALRKTGLGLIDVEVIWLRPGPPIRPPHARGDLNFPRPL